MCPLRTRAATAWDIAFISETFYVLIRHRSFRRGVSASNRIPHFDDDAETLGLAPISGGRMKEIL
jgi:hypothetical protein